jgi:ABC-2 type transport system permease protein
MSSSKTERSAKRAGTLSLVWLVAKRDYLRTVRRRGYLFGTLLLPVGIAALMAISTFFSVSGFEDSSSGGTSGGTTAIVIVNDSVVELSDVPGIDVSVVPLEQAEQMLESEQTAEYYVIPEGFKADGVVSRVGSGDSLSVSTLGSQDDKDDILRFLIRAALLEGANVPDADARRILEGVSVALVTVEGEEVSGLDIAAGIAVPMVFVGLFMISIFITSGYLLQSVTEEKENRVVEIVLSSIPPLPLMGGKILGLGGAGLTQVGIWVLTALVAIPLLSSQVSNLSGIEIDPTILVLALVYFVLGYLAYGAIFAAIGAIAPGNREAQQYSGFLGFFAAIPFILFAVFLSDISSTLVIALSIFPLTAPTSMLLVLGLSEEIPWTLVGASLTSLTLFALLATWASARIFRATVLLYGVRPSLKTVIGAVRSQR